MMNWHSEKRGDFGFMKHRNYPRMTWNCFVYESLARGRRWARPCPFSTATRLGRPKHIAFTLSLQVKRVFDDEGWFHPDFKVFILYDPSILYSIISKFLQNPSFPWIDFRSKDRDNFFSSGQVSALYPNIGFNIFPKLAVEMHRGMPFRIGCIDKGEASPHSTQGLFLVDDNE